MGGGRHALHELLDDLDVPAFGCGPDGREPWSNRSAQALLGVDAGEPVQRWGRWHGPDGRALPREELPLARVLAGEHLRDVEVMIKPAGAAPRFFRASGRRLPAADPAAAPAVVALREITARRRMSRMSSCEQVVGDLLGQQRTADDVIPEVLREIAVALEWTAAQFWTVDRVGQVLRDQWDWRASGHPPLAGPAELAGGQGLPGRAWHTSQPVWAPDLARHPDAAAQQTNWGRLRAGLAVPVPSGSATLAVMAFYSDSPEDIDDARTAVLTGIASAVGQFLERRRAERLDSELNRTREEYLNLIGHEVRTPLTAIESYTDLLLADPGLAEVDHAELLEVVQRNAKAMHGLVDTLLDVAALRAGDITVTHQPVELARLCHAAADAAHTAIGITVEVNTPEHVTVDGDPHRLRQALDELISTATEASSVAVNLRPEGASTVLTVSHTEPATAATAPGSGVPGTALGLTHVAAVVAAHGGELALTDTADPVTAITVRLPTRAPRP